jgi:hypothetical protein
MTKAGYVLLACLLGAPPAHATSACSVPAISGLQHTQGSNPNKAVFHLLPSTVYPLALCNDGSAGGYILRAGVGAGTSRWIIMLQAGGHCNSAHSCAARRQYDIANGGPRITGTGYLQKHPKAARLVGGLTSPSPTVNPDFYDANVAEIQYCSSDIYSGAVTGTPPFDGNTISSWTFQGRAIVLASIADLIATQNLAAAAQILLYGSSAGAVGVISDTRDIIPLLPPASRNVFVADGGFTLDIPAFDPNAPPPYLSPDRPTPGENLLLKGRALWRGRGDVLCNAHAHTKLQRALCMNTSTLLQSTAWPTPPLIVQAQRDTVQLSLDGIPDGRANTPAEKTYTSYFASDMRTFLAATEPFVSEYAPDLVLHTEMSSDAVFDRKRKFPGGPMSAMAAVHQWYLDPCTRTVNVQK